MCYIRDITPKSLFEVFPLEVIQTRLQMDLNIEQQKKRVSQWTPTPLPEFTQVFKCINIEQQKKRMSQFQDGIKRVAKQTDYHQHSFLGRNLIQPPRFPFLLSRKPSLLVMFSF